MDTKIKSVIEIKGARVHNLKNVDVEIPRDKFIVITGLSGSGKSSLAFDTLYAEGQRRYVESLSSYARQFLGRMSKPEVDFIKGIPPAIAIEQKVNTKNPRSTVGTTTEIYDFMKLLFARIGKTISPKSNKEVKQHTVSNVVDYIFSIEESTKLFVLSPLIIPENREFIQQLEILQQQGYTRLVHNNEIVKISDVSPETFSNLNNVFILIDRVKVAKNEDTIKRLSDSVQIAFYEGKGECVIKSFQNEVITKEFSDKFELDGILFEEPSVNMFSFNNPIGACPKCNGYGKVIGIDENLVIPNKSLSIFSNAVACWKGEKLEKWKKQLIDHADKFDFPIHRPYFELSEEQKDLLWQGNKYFGGINDFFSYLESKKHKIHARVMLARYSGKTKCHVCNGSRLKPEANYVKVGGYSIQELVNKPISELIDVFKNIELSDYEKDIAKIILIEIKSRLSFLFNVGLGYLTLNRESATLSGGESQRINLATSLGSSLVGSLYILDEPSIGLHSKDTDLLIKVLKQLKDVGNTVIVVEHDEDIINAADYIIDIGPYAGVNGGKIVFEGNYNNLISANKSLTAQYINNDLRIELPKIHRKWNNFIEVKSACENNLKGVNVKFPLYTFTAVTGVSGSGKSTLVNKILYQSLNKYYDGYTGLNSQPENLGGDLNLVKNIEFIDQNPIGKSSRSNPVTYMKAYDEIRKLFAEQQASKINGYKPSFFSFNVDGGRCDECQGEGTIKVEMQFMADVYLTCESCKGKRFKDHILDVRYRDKSIFDILEMSINEALEFFKESKGKLEQKICAKIQPLVDVGLGYVKMGQSSNTLSGGESQRIKLASFLGLTKSEHTLFIFDEPTTGLHFHDIKKLLKSFNTLVDNGNSILVIEHNLDVVKCADWVIDLGPEGGKNGGNIVFEGKPTDIINCKESYTGSYLKEKF